MKSSRFDKPQFTVGMIFVAIAVLMRLFLGDDYTVGAAGIGIVGLVSIATSRRK